MSSKSGGTFFTRPAEIAGLILSATTALLRTAAGCARTLEDLILVGILVHQRFERFIEVSQIARARARENLVASTVVSHDLACLDLEGLAEARLDQIDRNGKLVGDELRTV